MTEGRTTEPSPVAGLDAAVAEEIRNGGRLKSRKQGGAVIAYGGGVKVRVTLATAAESTRSEPFRD